MARIIIEADTPEELVAFARKWLDGAGSDSDADKFRKAIRSMTGNTQGFSGEVAQAVVAGTTMVTDSEYAKRYGKEHAGQLGGAIAAAWTAFNKYVGRDVLAHDRNAARYWMTREDAEHVLAALKELEK